MQSLLLILFLTTASQLFSQNDTLGLPFFEDWSSGSLETNGWTTNDSLWIVFPDEGNPNPSLQFFAENAENFYYSEVLSPVLSCPDFTEGDIWVSFDVKLECPDSAPYGWLKLRVWNEGSDYFKTIKSINNLNGGFDWKSYHINLFPASYQDNLKIMFEVFGKDGSNCAWYIDNINIYRYCTPAYDFIVHPDSLTNSHLVFNWKMDEPDNWIGWDDGINYSGIGAGACVTVAARWDTSMLHEYTNFRIKKMRAYINEPDFESLVFRIWQGGGEKEKEIYHDTIFDFEGYSWNERTLDTNLFIDPSKELWVGYSGWWTAAGTFPFGTDNGPAIAGYGDLIRTGCYENGEWDALSDFGLDYNWNIQFVVEDIAGNEIPVFNNQSIPDPYYGTLAGFNLYESVGEAEYTLIDFIPYQAGDQQFSKPFENDGFLHCFQLRAVWASEIDTCESAPALSKYNPEDNFVCVMLVGHEGHESTNQNSVSVYPNPFSNSTTFKYQLNQQSNVSLSIFNQLGEHVDLIEQNQPSGNQQIIWNAENHPSGFYYFVLKAGENVETGKLLMIE